MSANKYKLTVHSLFREYEAEFGGDVSEEIQTLSKRKRLHFIVDNKVYQLHRQKLGFLEEASSLIKIEAIESNKDIIGVQNIASTLLDNDISKNDILVVIGGGILQDLGAFVSNILKRGIEWYFIPTTLLAMCDSCIGSKCGINMAGFKNQLGVFAPPSRIFIDIDFLKTLEPSDLISGTGEIIKVHLISGEEDFENLSRHIDLLTTDFSVLERIILRSLEIKKSIVEEDEFDIDYRHILNYGHTFGHGIEAYTNNQIPHGIGVMIGMEIANYVSWQNGFLSEESFSKISKIVRKNIPNKQLDFCDTEKLSDSLRKDKKFDGTHLNVILCKGPGGVFKEKVCIDEKLIEMIGACIDRYNQLSE